MTKSLRRYAVDLFSRLPVVLSALAILAPAMPAEEKDSKASAAVAALVPSWSHDDFKFFMHGSMSTEFVPETVLRAFIRTYPDLFPTKDLSHLGLIPDSAFGWPVGFSRSEREHLGGMTSLGINCASCHVDEVLSAPGAPPLRVLGVTAHFDAEAFFGAVIVSTFRTMDPENMKKFIVNYLTEDSPADAAKAKFTNALLDAQWAVQREKIAAAIAADPGGAKGVSAAALHPLKAADFTPAAKSLADGPDFAALAQSFLKLFHNMRAALHVPDVPPEKAPPASGPGRNDAFGLLSATLLGAPQPYAPVKYGLVWNLDKRKWVHWDGNARSPIARNMLASLGLGAPLVGRRGYLDFAQLKRHTDLTERIRPPRYPFAVDKAAAKRGSAHYQARCASCHDKPEGDQRLHEIAAIGTDPARSSAFTQEQADKFNALLAGLDIPGYTPFTEPGIRGTGKLWAADLAGVWARSPYLHNGSVRTMHDLLTVSDMRPKMFHRGSRVYEAETMGFVDDGAYVLDTAQPGNSRAGHNFGTDLTADEKHDLIEFLKTP